VAASSVSRARHRGRDDGRAGSLRSRERPADPPVQERFFEDRARRREASHPNTATLFDVAGHDRRTAHEFVPGVTLHDEMAGRSVRPRRALDIAIQTPTRSPTATLRIVHGDVRLTTS
jgi:hypothetical protein